MAYTEAQKKNHIRELQGYLCAISYYHPEIPCIMPNSIYNQATENAVRKFQRLYGLTETGETNQATWNQIVSVYREDMHRMPLPLEAFPKKDGIILRPGESCFTVVIMQAILLEMAKHYGNFPSVAVTGEYDTQTMQAVQLFQKTCNLPVTGNVDCKTWNMLAQMGCELR